MMKSMNSSQLSPCEAVISSLPENGIEFGYCGVQQNVTRSFIMSNPSNAQVRFSIQSQEQGLFSVNINQGKRNLSNTLLSVECQPLLQREGSTSVTLIDPETLTPLVSF